MKTTNRRREKGISLLFAMFTLLLVTALAMGMMYVSSTETSVNSNFKASETAYFAARAGVEEVRDRMLPANANTLTPQLPTTLPGPSTGVLYVLANGVTPADITNSAPSNRFFDDELCHDWGQNSFGGMTYYPPNVRCQNLPAGGAGTWFTTAPTVAPFSASANPVDYKWVRVTLKENDSAAYLVDSSGPPGTNKVCWNGISEVVVPNNTTACDALSPTANPVYLVTALAVTPGGARRMIQQEIAQTPIGGFPYGLFATGRGCGALNLSGGSQTFGWNSSTGVTSANGGNVGSNGNMSFGGSGTAVHGTSGSAINGIGNCNQGNGITVSGGASYGTNTTIPIQSLPVPPPPNPLPPTTGCQAGYCYNSSQPLPPGAYGNVNISGGASITLTGGPPTNPVIYTMNSITVAGGSAIVISGGAVVLNIAGTNQQNPINLAGNSIQNTTGLPSNFVINYGGSKNISLSGGSQAYAVINAPNANITFSGNSNFYGQAIGATIATTGATNFYYDQSLNTPGPNNNPFYPISMRELAY